MHAPWEDVYHTRHDVRVSATALQALGEPAAAAAKQPQHTRTVSVLHADGAAASPPS
jgi:hypothetical protein